ncbi:MAG: homoserine kinase [Bacteroidales bacterium]|nr:homoserine kinase [Bacteroidales bacterium]
MTPDKIKVYSPATVANMVCGFDVLGFALDGPYDELTMSMNKSGAVNIRNLDNFNLPLKAEDNVIGGALLALMAALDDNTGFEIDSRKTIKPGSGIGSSAASAAGAVMGANCLLGNRFSKAELVDFAMYGEKVASGARHADNIAPAIYGGITLIRSSNPLDIVSIPFPPLYVTVLHPLIEVKTSNAREILKKEILLKDAAMQWGNVAGLVAGLMKGDFELIRRSLVDVIVEPVRKILIPGFDAVKSACLEAGALGGGISGSGPSIFMLSETLETANEVAKAIHSCYGKIGIEYDVHVSNINPDGVKIILDPKD